MAQPTPPAEFSDETVTIPEQEVTSTTIVKRTTGLTADEMAGIESWDDLKPFLAQYDTVAVATELGDGTKVVEQAALVGKAFIILALDFPMGDFGEYALVRGMTQNGAKFRFSDGSTGIYRQLSEWMAKREEQFVPLMVPNGLTSSTYTVRDDEGNPILTKDGNETKATTYYLDTTETML